MDLTIVVALVALSTVLGVAAARAVIWMVLAGLNQAILQTHVEPATMAVVGHDARHLPSAA